MAILKVTDADLTSSSNAAAAAAGLPAAAQRPVGGGPASRGSGLWPFRRSGTSGGGSGLAGLFSSSSSSSSSRPAGQTSSGVALGLSSSSPGGPASAALRRLWATAHALRSGSANAAVAAAAGSGLQLPQGGAGAVAGVGLVIDGAALAVALQPQHEDDLLALCKECSAVICCRVSPMQKAQVCSVHVCYPAGLVQLLMA
jgi:hypothetical protein